MYKFVLLHVCHHWKIRIESFINHLFGARRLWIPTELTPLCLSSKGRLEVWILIHVPLTTFCLLRDRSASTLYEFINFWFQTNNFFKNCLFLFFIQDKDEMIFMYSYSLVLLFYHSWQIIKNSLKFSFLKGCVNIHFSCISLYLKWWCWVLTNCIFTKICVQTCITHWLCSNQGLSRLIVQQSNITAIEVLYLGIYAGSWDWNSLVQCTCILTKYFLNGANGNFLIRRGSLDWKFYCSGWGELGGGIYFLFFIVGSSAKLNVIK